MRALHWEPQSASTRAGRLFCIAMIKSSLDRIGHQQRFGRCCLIKIHGIVSDALGGPNVSQWSIPASVSACSTAFGVCLKWFPVRHNHPFKIQIQQRTRGPLKGQLVPNYQSAVENTDSKQSRQTHDMPHKKTRPPRRFLSNEKNRSSTASVRDRRRRRLITNQ
jgi:hypothetical protein